eukprot:1022970-Pelagomonas_calceolata.AAC.1
MDEWFRSGHCVWADEGLCTAGLEGATPQSKPAIVPAINTVQANGSEWDPAEERGISARDSMGSSRVEYLQLQSTPSKHGYLCTQTNQHEQHIMRDAVSAPQGHTFDKRAYSQFMHN